MGSRFSTRGNTSGNPDRARVRTLFPNANRGLHRVSPSSWSRCSLEDVSRHPDASHRLLFRVGGTLAWQTLAVQFRSRGDLLSTPISRRAATHTNPELVISFFACSRDGKCGGSRGFRFLDEVATPLLSVSLFSLFTISWWRGIGGFLPKIFASARDSGWLCRRSEELFESKNSS